MGMNFGVLLNAALGGVPAYQGGVRQGRAVKRKEIQDDLQLTRAEELRQSQLAENRSQATAAEALAARRKDEIDHPEKYRTPRAKTETEQYTEYYDGLIASGVKPADADRQARQRFGKNQDDPYTSPQARAQIERDTHAINRNYDVAHPTRDTGEGGSAKDATDRREFMQNRITHWIDQGYSSREAQTRAETEYRGAQYSAGAVTRGLSPTAAALGKFTDVSSGKGSSSGGPSSANAGKSGVKPTETSSTQKANPTDPNSPKRGAIKPATDADIDRAIDAVGNDPAKVAKWLHDHGFTE